MMSASYGTVEHNRQQNHKKAIIRNTSHLKAKEPPAHNYGDRLRAENKEKSEILLEKLEKSKRIWKEQVELHLDAYNKDIRNKIISKFIQAAESSDWQVGDVPVTKGSAQTFMMLYKKLEPTCIPHISCNYDGNVTMTWGQKEDCLNLICFPRNYAIFFVSYKENGENVGFSDRKRVNEIVKTLASRGILEKEFFTGIE